MATINDDSTFYVYVYIDPRNYEEFYYGKGIGKRKDAHLRDGSDSDKAQRIRDIHKAGLKPIIRVIAKGMNEKEALLVEKTLLWKLGKTLTNKSRGFFKAQFRPVNTMYRELQGFDFRNEIYYINVGEGKHRSWDDCRKYQFLSAGGGKRFTDKIRSLSVGDVVVAYLKRYGYVGVGVVQKEAVEANDYHYNGTPLSQLPLKESGILFHSFTDKADWLVNIKWKKSFKREDAKWKSNGGLFTTQLIKASLAGQPKTLSFIEKSFGITFSSFLKA